ncbi:MAG: sialate O-acetylesterase, partial [bacterium]
KNPADLSTIYGRMLWRVQQSKLTHGIRAVLWHQGESDQGTGCPGGGYGWETYQQHFVDMSAGWKRDYPNIRHYYTYQIVPGACAMGGEHGNMLREVQRTLPRLYSNMDVMSTLGIKPIGTCHYPLTGWSEFARMIQPLIERDFYGKAPTASITAPDLKRAYYAGAAKDAIALAFDQPVVWKDSLVSEFYLDDTPGKVASGAVAGNVITLKLKEASAAKKITYLKSWNQEKLIVGANGIAALTFCDVALESEKR